MAACSAERRCPRADVQADLKADAHEVNIGAMEATIIANYLGVKIHVRRVQQFCILIVLVMKFPHSHLGDGLGLGLWRCAKAWEHYGLLGTHWRCRGLRAVCAKGGHGVLVRVILITAIMSDRLYSPLNAAGCRFGHTSAQ